MSRKATLEHVGIKRRAYKAARATNKKDHLALEEGTDSPLRPPGKSDLIKPQDYSRCFAAYYTIFCHEKIVGEIIGGLQSGTPHTNYGK